MTHFVWASFLLLCVWSCAHSTRISPNLEEARLLSSGEEATPGSLPLCLAMRGNGELIMSHFGAMARITEAYGIVDGMAGGSSGSASTFMYESMMMNPQVNQCGTRPCSKSEKAMRMALLLKTTQGYVKMLGKTDEALAASGILALIEETKRKGIGALLEQGRLNEAKKELNVLLSNPELRSLINPEMYRLLSMGRVQEIYEQINMFGKFEAKEQSIFFRPGLVNFKAFPEVLGKIADFYAGRGNYDGQAMNDFFDKCAVSSNVGKLWDEITADPENPCATMFDNMATDYRKNYRMDGKFPHRRDDPIGGTLPSLVSTSVLEGPDLVNSWKKNMKEYWKNPNPKYDFKVPFDRVKFGYWGRPEDLKKVKLAFHGSSDAKAQKFLALGPAGSTEPGLTKWSEALRTSPAEPGLANIQPIDKNRLSVGGWSDLHPIQALKAMGCNKVIYVTRTGPESTFAVGVARLLGMTPEEETKLYALDQKQGRAPSSFLRALHLADGIWCTDWNIYKGSQIAEAMRDGYGLSNGEHAGASMVTQAATLMNPAGAVFNLLRNSTLLGCDGRLQFVEESVPHRARREQDTH